MKIAIWDTYVKRQEGLRMHFDILVEEKMTDKAKIFDFGKNYLKNKAFKTGQLTTKECVFCHIGTATATMENEILKKGYYIIEMENCD